MIGGREVIASIERASRDPHTRAVAARIYAEAAASALADEHERKDGKVRASDAGRCKRELWADLHGKFDMPQDVVTQLTRFDIGTIYGAWLGALLKADLEKHDPNVHVDLEVTIERHNVPGHVDVVVRRCLSALLLPRPDDYQPELVVEFKSTYGMKNRDLPSEKRVYQVVQTGHYALALGAPRATIVTCAPAAYPVEDRFTYEDIDPEVWALTIDTEIDRLSEALLEPEPDADPDAPSRCMSCRYGACPNNKNPMARTLSMEE